MNGRVSGMIFVCLFVYLFVRIGRAERQRVCLHVCVCAYMCVCVCMSMCVRALGIDVC